MSFFFLCFVYLDVWLIDCVGIFFFRFLFIYFFLLFTCLMPASHFTLSADVCCCNETVLIMLSTFLWSLHCRAKSAFSWLGRERERGWGGGRQLNCMWTANWGSTVHADDGISKNNLWPTANFAVSDHEKLKGINQLWLFTWFAGTGIFWLLPKFQLFGGCVCTRCVEGFWPECCISTIYHCRDTPFWLETLVCTQHINTGWHYFWVLR